MTSLQDDHVVLLEKTVRSNERIVRDNDEFREELRSRERAQNEVLQDLVSKIQRLEESPRFTTRKRKRSSARDRNLDVPPACRKLTRRTLALEMVNWPKEVKGKMAEVLTEDYMSSEESECEENVDGEITVSAYAVKDLVWESERLKRRKAKLDKAFKKSQSPRSQKRTIKRIRKDGFSSARNCPQDAPSWVVTSAVEH